MNESVTLENIIKALQEGNNKKALELAKERLGDSHGSPSIVKQTPRNLLPEFVTTLAISATASATGAAFVYPIDLAKTRMQNQRSGNLIEGIKYKNSLDCLRKVVQNEGVASLYKGLGTNLMGQVPEKAIRLFVIDRIRSVCMNYYGKSLYQDSKRLKYLTEMTAGFCVGALQVIITNPAEIIKVRLQLTDNVNKTTISSIVNDIGGVKGLYKGASACFLRDIPFSGIYFPVYAICKDVFNLQNNNYIDFFTIMLSGSIAGMAAASVTTPADVIKTRLQAKNSSEYKGLFDCLHKIIYYEGYSALFKGLMPRIIRSSPQYGCMLVTYEILLKLFKEEEITPQMFDQQISYSMNTNVRDKYFSLKQWTPPSHFYNFNLSSFKTISVGGSGTIWALTEDNKPYFWNGINWHEVPLTKLSTISCGADGTACGIDAINNSIQIWSPWHMKFFAIPNVNNLNKVSVGNADKIWAIDNNGTVYKYEREKLWEPKGTIKMKHVSVGSDGTVYGIDVNGSPFKWQEDASNWEKLQCSVVFKQISVGSSANVWALDVDNTIYQYINNYWSPQDRKMSHISAAQDGTVLGLIQRMRNTQK